MNGRDKPCSVVSDGISLAGSVVFFVQQYTISRLFCRESKGKQGLSDQLHSTKTSVVLSSLRMQGRQYSYPLGGGMQS